MRFRHRSLLASILIVALLASTTAYLTHKHPLAVGQADTGHCGLCLQFDRVAGAPATAAIVVGTLWILAATVPHAITPRIVRAGARLPEARAPPESLPLV